MHNLDAHRAKQMLVYQLVIATITVLAALMFGTLEAREAFIGGFAALSGNAVFAFWIFGPYSAQEPGRLVSRFYGGELIKISTIVIVFALAMKHLNDLQPVAMFVAFFVVQVLPPLLANRIAR